jgi:hypothetical protein
VEIIGLSGKAGSGKDYVGREVLRPNGYRQWAFAWPMKNQAVGRGFSFDEVHNTKPPAVRNMLQQIGTEEGWKIHGKNYWTDIAGAWLRTMQENFGFNRFYFADTRFEHEVDFIRSLGGKVVRMELGDRPPRLVHNCMSNELRYGGCPACHSSETALDRYTKWDLVIQNGLDATSEEIRYAMTDAGIIKPEQRELFDVPAVPLGAFTPCSS